MSLDKKIVRFFNVKLNNRFLDMTLPTITRIADLRVSLVLSFLYLFFQRKNLDAYKYVFGFLLTQFFVYLIKWLCKRKRPYWVMDDLVDFGYDHIDHSFPSGHSATCFYVATFFLIQYNISFLIFIPALLIALSRIYLGVHYITDIIIGASFGIAIAILVQYYLWDIVMLYGRSLFS